MPLGVEAPSEPQRAKPTPRIGRLHGLSIIGMAVSALAGIASMLAFITISWPDDLGRYLMAIFVFSVVGFMTSASFAVFSAARDTYPRHSRTPPSNE
ncbi:MAG: hypothetical protein M3124_02500 [Actinomycetota bacterium]|nr:hypothetical protein [Actinomycetota bacterium]